MKKTSLKYILGLKEEENYKSWLLIYLCSVFVLVLISYAFSNVSHGYVLAFVTLFTGSFSSLQIPYLSWILSIAFGSLFICSSLFSWVRGYVTGFALILFAYLFSSRQSPFFFFFVLVWIGYILIFSPLLYFGRKVYQKISGKNLKIGLLLFLLIIPITLFVYSTTTCKFGKNLSCVLDKAVSKATLDGENIEACDSLSSEVSGLIQDCYYRLAVQTQNRLLCKNVDPEPADGTVLVTTYKCIEDTPKNIEFDQWLINKHYESRLNGLKQIEERSAGAGGNYISGSRSFINCYDINNGKVQETLDCIERANKEYYSLPDNYLKILGY